MNKIILLAALGVAGLVSAKNAKIKEKKLVENEKSTKTKIFFNPVRLQSSCGYVEFIDLGGF